MNLRITAKYKLAQILHLASYPEIIWVVEIYFQYIAQKPDLNSYPCLFALEGFSIYLGIFVHILFHTSL
jgi:hypothetical protein